MYKAKYFQRNPVRGAIRYAGGYGSNSTSMFGNRRRIAASRIQRAARSYIMTKRRKNTTSGVGVTTQHDARLIYRKRTMPAFKKRAWKGFVRKVNAVSEKELGNRTVVFNISEARNNTTSGNCADGAFYLYPFVSTTSYANDIANVSGFENTLDPTAAAGVTIDPSSKYLFQSAVLDLTVRNTSKGNGGTATENPRMELDVYEITMSRDKGNYNVNNFLEVLNTNVTTTRSIGGGGTEIIRNQRGVTPWELSFALSRFGLKIWKKTKYTLSQGETFTYQVRDPKRYQITRNELSTVNGFNRRGMTRIIYMQGKLVPGLTVGSAVDTYTESFTVGLTRKYMYKVEGVNDDRTQYVVA